MQTYSIRLKCPSCGKEFYERRLKPYKYRITKMCPTCKDDVDRLKVKVVGGKGENILISITGNIDLKTVSKLSKSMGIEGMENLDNIEKEKKKEKD